MSISQIPIPQLFPIITLTEPQKSINTEYWPNLITSCKSPKNALNTFITYPSKSPFIQILYMENGCIISKRQYKVNYSIHHKITMLHLCAMKKEEGIVLSTIYCFIGYEDGVVDLYCIAEIEESGYTFIKLDQIIPNVLKNSRKEPVVNAGVWRNNLIICTVYHVILYEKYISIQTSATSVKKACKQLQLFQSKNRCKLNMFLSYSTHYLYTFNEWDGLVCFNLQKMKEESRVQDSIRAALPISNSLLAFGSTDNSIKFIDFQSAVVHKFVGFKNYASCISADKNGVIWVGLLDGSIACFEQSPQVLNNKNKQSIFLAQKKIRKSQTICENGISNLIISNDVLIMKDCEHNIYLYDVVAEVCL